MLSQNTGSQNSGLTKLARNNCTLVSVYWAKQISCAKIVELLLCF